MQKGKFNVLLDQHAGSSGKGAMSSRLVEKFSVSHVSSANYPNAGHTIQLGERKFIAKAIPTACGLHAFQGRDVVGFISPGSGFSWGQLLKEWKECGMPKLIIHERASVVTDDHKRREEAGGQSTRHIASTMQGSGAAIVDKVMRLPHTQLAGPFNFYSVRENDAGFRNFFLDNPNLSESFLDKVKIENALEFRRTVQGILASGNTWLHEGSQGYALSIDHGIQYPYTTSRNCDTQMALSYMGVAPQLLGDVYLNLRTFPIRVGNVYDEKTGERVGYSGDWYEDQQELTWEQVGTSAGMPLDDIKALSVNEKTTVTKRIRRVSTFSWIGLEDAVRTCGATKLCVNFPQYLDWNDHKVRGEGKSGLEKLSKKTREFIDRCEAVAQIPVVMVGTGADHRDLVDIDA